MMDFLTALGLMFLLEGALYALFPVGMKRALAQLQTLPASLLRVGGLVFAVFGFLIIAVLRGY
jgi:uncharacterized protein YjeT (DUF2065 family)